MSKSLTPKQMKNKARGWSRDMSPKAVMRRLEIVSEMNELCGWLGKAKILGRTEDLEKESA